MTNERKLEVKPGVYITIAQAEQLKALIPESAMVTVFTAYNSDDKQAYERARDALIIEPNKEQVLAVVNDERYTIEDFVGSIDRVMSELRQLKLLHAVVDVLSEAAKHGELSIKVVGQPSEVFHADNDGHTLH